MENKKIMVSISTLALITVIALSLVPPASCTQATITGDETYPNLYVRNSDWTGIETRSYDGDALRAHSYGGGAADDGVYGTTTSPDWNEAGVHGYSSSSACGVYGASSTGYGVRGSSSTTHGVRGIGGSGTGDYGGYFTSGYRGLYASKGAGSNYAAIFNGHIHVTGNIYKSGAVSFVTDHPTKQNKEIVYVCLEGGETGTYTRGSAQLKHGMVTVKLPEDFSLVTSTEGLTAQVTPTGDCNGLYVVRKSPTEIVVKELDRGKSDATFDYLVNGIRIGYEDFEPIQSKTKDSGPELVSPELAPVVKLPAGEKPALNVVGEKEAVGQTVEQKAMGQQKAV